LSRLTLNAEGIYRAALALVDAEGLEALTMRRLAAELGVATMSIYSHVATKEDLLLGVVNMVAADIRLPDPKSPPWEALRSVTRDFRRVALEHPNLVPLIMRQPPTGAEGLLTLEAALDALRRAGIAPSLTARAYRLSASYAIGFVSLEVGGFFRPVDVAAGDRIAPVDLTAIPRIAEVAQYLSEWDADAEFENGMDVIIGVLASWAAPSQPSQVVEGDGGRGGDVQGVDAPAHGDTDLVVGSA
jgi:AcrR family transcriptional regulator